MRVFHAVCLLASGVCIILAACTSQSEEDIPNQNATIFAGATASATAQLPETFRTSVFTIKPTPGPSSASIRILQDEVVKVSHLDGTLELGVLPAGFTVTGVYTDYGPDSIGIPGVGWITYDPTTIELSVPFNSIPYVAASFLGPSHPVGTRTGIPMVDRVVDLVQSKDVAGLTALATNRQIPCEVGYSPDCPSGMAPGTEVSVFSTSACSGDYWPTAEQPVRRILSYSTEPAALFAVADLVSPTHGPSYTLYFASMRPAGSTVQRDIAYALSLNNSGQVASIAFGCGAAPAFRANTPFVLPPVKPAVLR